MDKYMRAAVIGAAIIVLAFILVCLLFPLTGKAQGDVRPQILVVYDHKVPSGTIVGEAKARVILGLRQADPEKRLAPIEKKTLMLCRPHNEGNHVMFRCGQDEYIMESFNLEPLQ